MRHLSRALILLVTMMWTGCGSSPNSPSSSANLTVMLKDSPYSDAKALLVTFSDVSVHSSGDSWVKLPFAASATSRTCDLKKLTTAQDILGTAALAPGHYTQIRLTVSSAALYFDNTSGASPACADSITAPLGASSQVSVPSGEVKLNREFDLQSGGATPTMILVDFDGDQSIHQTGAGSFMMTPVISIVSVQ
jgi:uncharacterized protein DUF4382